jgi:hypothetical protein|nr:MAG TPA: hypothetical protein [Bacteriophage sp.]
MTENEAIREVRFNMSTIGLSDKAAKRVVEARNMAIKALETIKKLSDRKMTSEVLENYMQFEDECVKKGFAFKSVIEAREKQIAKKPTYEGDGYAPDGTLIYDTWICPCCDKRYEVDYDDYDYCPNCGQKLDLDRDEQPTAFSMRAKPIDNFVNPFEVKAGGNS